MKMNYPFQINRMYNKPLDDDKVFKTIARMNAYLKDPTRYAGQMVTCLETPGYCYILDNDRATWLPISATAPGIPGDDSAAVDGTPVNPVYATATLTAGEIALLANNDTVTFDGVVFTKAAATDGTDFADAAGLAAAIKALQLWEAAVSEGNVVVTAANWGVDYNDIPLNAVLLEATTASGDGAGTAATATIPAATITEMDVGDIIEFNGSTLVKAAATDAEADEWADAAGIAACITAMTDWGATVSEGAVVITAATDSADFNDYPVVITLYRATGSGANGTSGMPGQLRFDSAYMYLCVDDNTWRRIAHSALG